MGAAFLAHQVWEYAHLDFTIHDNAYASIFLVTTGLHGLHVLAGLLISAVVQLKARLGPVHRRSSPDGVGVQPLLALRRRRVGLRLLVALPLGAPRMTPRPGLGSTATASPSCCCRWPPASAPGPSTCSRSSSLARLDQLHPDVDLDHAGR